VFRIVVLRQGRSFINAKMLLGRDAERRMPAV
jgi:hypothetical protein